VYLLVHLVMQQRIACTNSDSRMSVIGSIAGSHSSSRLLRNPEATMARSGMSLAELSAQLPTGL
jgi:hypothetical protein